MADEKHEVKHAPPLVKMVRATAQFKGGPTTASVPHSEVKHFEAGGWHIEKETK